MRLAAEAEAGGGAATYGCFYVLTHRDWSSSISWVQVLCFLSLCAFQSTETFPAGTKKPSILNHALLKLRFHLFSRPPTYAVSKRSSTERCRPLRAQPSQNEHHDYHRKLYVRSDRVRVLRSAQSDRSVPLHRLPKGIPSLVGPFWPTLTLVQWTGGAFTSNAVVLRTDFRVTKGKSHARV